MILDFMQKFYAICAKNERENDEMGEKILFLLCERKLE